MHNIFASGHAGGAWCCAQPAKRRLIMHAMAASGGIYPSSASAGPSTFLPSITDTKASARSAQQCYDITAQL